MKKLILTILFSLFCLTANAATRTIDSDATNWSAATSWVEGAVPLATDAVVANASSASITIDTTTCVASTMVLTGYTGTMTFTAGQKLTVTTTVTFVAGMTIAGTGTLQLSNTATITSGGKTFTGDLIFDAGTWTLADNWTVTGSVMCQTSSNQLASNTLTIGGSLTSNLTMSGTTSIVMNGTGTLSTASTSYAISNNITINTTGTITIGSVLGRGSGTITYVTGTVDTTTNSSLLFITAGCTLNTNGINWYNITVYIQSNATITLGSNLTCTNNFTLVTTLDILTLSGAYNISCANFKMPGIDNSGYSYAGTGSTWNMPSSQTLTVTNSIMIEGDNSLATTLKSVTSSTAFNLDYNGTAANCQVYEATFTDVDASLSAQGIDNWYGGTLTRTTNITNVTSADIGGAATGGGASFFTMGN